MNSKHIEGYENLYSINRSRTVNKLNKGGTTLGKVIRSFKGTTGVEYVNLSKNGIRRTFKVDNLFACAFGEPRDYRYREEFKSVAGEFGGLYEISNHGRLYKLPCVPPSGIYQAGKMIKQSKNSKGYMIVSMRFEGEAKIFSVGALVGRAFLGLDLNTRVYYKTNDKTNNHINNLILKRYGR